MLPLFCKIWYVLLIFLVISCAHTVSAQKPELPLHEDLKNASEKMRVRMGVKPANKTFGIKVGDFIMARSQIKRKYDDGDKFLGVPMNNSHLSSFSTFLTSKANDTAYIDVARNITKSETNEIILFNYFVVREYELLEDSNFSSVFINTNLDKDDNWLLVLSASGYWFPVSDTYLTNGKSTITVKALQTEPFGSILKTASQGIELYLYDEPIAALQYRAGGGFGYKQYAWISDQATTQQKLVIAAAFAAILELMQGGKVYYFD